jgi:hypothetical protein
MDTTQANELLNQIGPMNIMAISGGRKVLNGGVLVLPVANGYSVEIEYNEGSDTYTVRRVFTRGIKRWIKGEVTEVYCDQVGEIAYQAHAFRSYEFGAAA